jgi:hypothetical protein
MQIPNSVFQFTPFYPDVQIADAELHEFAIRQIGPRELHLEILPQLKSCRPAFRHFACAD